MISCQPISCDVSFKGSLVLSEALALNSCQEFRQFLIVFVKICFSGYISYKRNIHGYVCFMWKAEDKEMYLFFVFWIFQKWFICKHFEEKLALLLISPFISILLFIFLHCKVFLHSLFFSMLDNPTINVPLWSIHLLYITKFTESAKASNSVCFLCYLEFSPWFYVFVCSELLSLFYHCKFDFHTNSPLIMENVVERSSKMNDVTNRVDISINM